MTAMSIPDFVALTEAELPMAARLGVKPELITAERARVRLPFRAELNRPGGTVAGPAMMALADYTMYAVILGRDARLTMAVTSNLSIHFLRKPGPVDLIAEGRALKFGRRLAVLDVIIHSDGDPAPVAHVTGTYALPG